ncbi:major capsid protein [Microviridae sp.]|nr:major capsid protein [Microviridae sp.]
MHMKSVMSHNFAVAPQANIPRSSFDRSFGYKTTFKAGYLIPYFIDEVLPGDTFNFHSTIFARMATPIFPLMDNLHLDTQFFFVPNRLLWDNWQKFMGERSPNPSSSISFTIPQMVATAVTGYLNGSLHDYFGLPTQVPGFTHSSLWHRAYNLIYNEWYRDENLQNSSVVDVDDGPDSPTDYVLLRRGKRYDYFTSCLTSPQKGTAVSLPLGTTAPVLTSGTQIQMSTPAVVNAGLQYQLQAGVSEMFLSTAADATNRIVVFGANTGLYTDLSTATAATINQLRLAFQVQELLERDARGGTRYVELIKAHFNVISPDFRLQRPEYLGGGTSLVTMNPIPQTSSTDATSPQGNLAATASVIGHGHGFVKSFVEHGIVMGILSVRADLTYQKGLDRMFSRLTRYDFYFPAFSNLGEQAVLNQEIYCQGTANPTEDAAVFGYQERWSEMRFMLSKITGQYRSNFAQTLDAWHLSQNFTSLPVLDTTFIQETPPMDRVTATTDAAYPDFLMDSYNKYICARPMPRYSVPVSLNRF